MKYDTRKIVERAQHRRFASLPGPRGKVHDKVCPQCSLQFKGTPTQVYCSRRCAGKSYWGNRT